MSTGLIRMIKFNNKMEYGQWLHNNPKFVPEHSLAFIVWQTNKLEWHLNDYSKGFHKCNIGIEVGAFIPKILAWNKTLSYSFVQMSWITDAVYSYHSDQFLWRHDGIKFWFSSMKSVPMVVFWWVCWELCHWHIQSNFHGNSWSHSSVCKMITNLVKFATVEQFLDQVVCTIPMQVKNVMSVANVNFENHRIYSHFPPLKYVKSF